MSKRMIAIAFAIVAAVSAVAETGGDQGMGRVYACSAQCDVEFGCPDSEFCGLQSEIGFTTHVAVPLTRTNPAAVAQSSKNIVVVTYPDGQSITSTIDWPAGVARQTFDCDTASLAAVGDQISIALCDDAGVAYATNHITAVGQVGNSPVNPLWMGERTADTLEFGEWTMDIDAAVNKCQMFNAATGNRAYALVYVGGSLWCPDCIAMDRNFLQDGRFRTWARSRNVSLVAIDIPNYSIYEGYGHSTSLLSYDTCRVQDAYISGIGTWPADETLRLQSGTPYLSRHMVSQDEADAIAARNCFFACTSVMDGGFRRPWDGNKYRVPVPTFILFRDDGSVAGRITGFADPVTRSWDDAYLTRFDELLDMADSGDSEKDDWYLTTDRLLEMPGSVTNTLSAVDTADYYRIPSGKGRLVATVDAFDLESPCQGTLQVVEVVNGSVVTLASTNFDTSAAATIVAFVDEGKEVYVSVQTDALAHDSPQSFSREDSTVAPYALSVALDDRYHTVTLVYGIDQAAGALPREIIVLEGNGCVLPQPTFDGYQFAGWFTDKTLGRKVETGEIIDGDVTLYAHWTGSWTVAFGSKWYEALADDEGVTCAGWKDFYMGANIAIPVTVSDLYGENIPLKPEYITIKPGTYVDYGSPYILSEQEMWETYGRPVFDARDEWGGLGLDRDGGIWVYNNWDWEDVAGFTYELEKGIWPVFDNDYGDYSDVDDWLEAYADRQWIIIPTGKRPQKGTHTFTVLLQDGDNVVKYPVSFTMSADQKAKAATVRFNANGGKVSEYGRVVTLNKVIGALPVPDERRGYTFKGWYTAKTKGTKISASTKVTKAMTVYAQWTPKKYRLRVRYVEIGKVVRDYTKTYTFAVGTKVTFKPVPKDKSLVFGWWEGGFGPENEEDEKYCNDSMSYGWNYPSLSFTMPPCNLFAGLYFVQKKDCVTPRVSLSGGTDGSTPWYVEDGDDVSIHVDSDVYCTLDANKTIPAGMSLVRLSKYDDEWKLKVVNAAKLPAGIRTIKLTAKTSAGKKKTVSFKVVLPNKTQAVDAGALALDNLDSRDCYTLEAGVKNQWSALGISGQNGWALSSVTGIPGLTWDAKNKKMKGVPSKAGLYTATFTVTKGKSKKSATANFCVEPLPAGVVGTFYGSTYVPTWEWDEENEEYNEMYWFGKKSRRVVVTAGPNGGITFKVGTLSMSATGWTIDENGNYTASAHRKTIGSKYRDDDEIYIVVNPSAAWNADALTGSFSQFRSVLSNCDKGKVPKGTVCAMTPTWERTTDTEIFARKSATATSAEAKEIAAKYAALGKQGFIVEKASSDSGYAYDAICQNCYYGTKKATLFAKVESNGKMTLAGTIAGTKVSGTAYLSYEYDYVVARFFFDKFVIEIAGSSEYVYNNGSLNGYVWKK